MGQQKCKRESNPTARGEPAVEDELHSSFSYSLDIIFDGRLILLPPENAIILLRHVYGAGVLVDHCPTYRHVSDIASYLENFI